MPGREPLAYTLENQFCNATPCPNGTSDCAAGEICIVDTCCAGPVCLIDQCPLPTVRSGDFIPHDESTVTGQPLTLAFSVWPKAGRGKKRHAASRAEKSFFMGFSGFFVDMAQDDSVFGR